MSESLPTLDERIRSWFSRWATGDQPIEQALRDLCDEVAGRLAPRGES